MKTFSDQDVKFLLKEPNSDKPTLISMVYRFNNQRLVYSTEQSIEPAQWDSTRQRARTDQRKQERIKYENINAALEECKRQLKKAITNLDRSEESISIHILKNELNRLLGKEKNKLDQQPKKVISFFDFVEFFIEECKSGKRLTRENKRYAESTIKDYRKTLNQLKAFEIFHKQKLNYESFTMEFYDQLKRYLTKKGQSLNTIGALIKNIKLLLMYSYKDGLHYNRIFENKDFKKLQEEVDNIYLNEKDLEKIVNLNLTKNLRLDKIRDIFIIGCYTGLRFSDFSQLKSENISSDNKKLTIVTKKKGRKVTVPLHPIVFTILNKYNFTTPRVASNQKFNDYLKELGKIAELNERVQTTRTKGGKPKTTTSFKWELITTHTARRSFATNAYKSGMNIIDIMMLTGHKTETNFMKYIKVTPEEVADRLTDHPFFTGHRPKIEEHSLLKKVA